MQNQKIMWQNIVSYVYLLCVSSRAEPICQKLVCSAFWDGWVDINIKIGSDKDFLSTHDIQFDRACVYIYIYI